jgi:alkylation response protein AidB-like acyl-CoA dehydrogenase
LSGIRSAFEHLVQASADSLPFPGGGNTWSRFEALSKWAAQDLSLGRLLEGHCDARAILAEAGSPPAAPGATYGVWAARSPRQGTTARLDSDGWHLAGQKPFCSGSGLIERALVTADTADGYRLFDIDVARHVVATRPDSWQAVGMADSQSETLEFGGPPLPFDRAVGDAGFYLDRPGFWFGAIGVAACWYGGAAGMVEHLGCTLDPHSPDPVLVEFGHAAAHVAAMRHVLEDASGEIDEDPIDQQGRARARAHVVRHAVHHGALRVMEHIAAAGGARPLCHDRRQGQRAADLYVYLAQHHGSADAQELGRIAVEGRAWN